MDGRTIVILVIAVAKIYDSLTWDLGSTKEQESLSMSPRKEPISSANHCMAKPHPHNDWWSVNVEDPKEFYTVEHDCKGIPAIIDVQVRPVSGGEKNFIFPGLSSFQSASNVNNTTGGVVYKYNNESIHLYVTHTEEHLSAAVKYTGGSRWSGPVSQTETSAKVEVKVWCTNDLPPPTFESNWTPILNKRDLSFQEVFHNLSREPALVTVQVDLGRSGWITDGIGSVTTMPPTGNSTWSGVIYGYNDRSVRIWASPQDGGKLFTVNGNNDRESYTVGGVKIKAWSNINVLTKTVKMGQKEKIDHIKFDTPINTDEDLLRVTIKGLDGRNKDFQFMALGAVQSSELDGSYGGVVVSFSNDTVRLWTPWRNDESGPINNSLTNTDAPLVNDQYSQQSSELYVTVHLYRVGKTCFLSPSVVSKAPSTEESVQAQSSSSYGLIPTLDITDKASIAELTTTPGVKRNDTDTTFGALTEPTTTPGVERNNTDKMSHAPKHTSTLFGEAELTATPRDETKLPTNQGDKSELTTTFDDETKLTATPGDETEHKTSPGGERNHTDTMSRAQNLTSTCGVERNRTDTMSRVPRWSMSVQIITCSLLYAVFMKGMQTSLKC